MKPSSACIRPPANLLHAARAYAELNQFDAAYAAYQKVLTTGGDSARRLRRTRSALRRRRQPQRGAPLLTPRAGAGAGSCAVSVRARASSIAGRPSARSRRCTRRGCRARTVACRRSPKPRPSAAPARTSGGGSALPQHSGQPPAAEPASLPVRAKRRAHPRPTSTVDRARERLPPRRPVAAGPGSLPGCAASYAAEPGAAEQHRQPGAPARPYGGSHRALRGDSAAGFYRRQRLGEPGGGAHRKPASKMPPAKPGRTLCTTTPATR